jgi:D-alanine-D-alanine ligase-like ATP-grasp enzyme
VDAPYRQGDLQPLCDFIEFKFIKPGELGLAAGGIRNMDRETLLEKEKVRQVLAAARTQLQDYRTTLMHKYEDRLRLRCFAVVAIGFERQVWESVRNI